MVDQQDRPPGAGGGAGEREAGHAAADDREFIDRVSRHARNVLGPVVTVRAACRRSRGCRPVWRGFFAWLKRLVRKC
jgi:hypothetical protein